MERLEPGDVLVIRKVGEDQLRVSAQAESLSEAAEAMRTLPFGDYTLVKVLRNANVEAPMERPPRVVLGESARARRKPTASAGEDVERESSTA